MTTRRQLLRGLLSMGAASAIWLPTAHCAMGYRRSLPDIGPLPSWIMQLAERHLAIWEAGDGEADIAKMREVNAEWDFMGRTFLVLALANIALWDRRLQKRILLVLDRIIEDTLALEKKESMYYFLMDYAKGAPWLYRPEQSLFVEGEIALMIGARRLLEDTPSHKREAGRRVRRILSQMNAGPIGSAESYPDECWTFCNTTALAALRCADAVDKTEHHALYRRWLEVAKTQLIDKKTGLLVSSYALDGTLGDGPEGSSIFMSAHNLLLLDEEFAADQYRRSKTELVRGVLGFRFAREWPKSQVGPVDVDSGPIVPYLEASPSASGFAVLAASAFGDQRLLRDLIASLELTGFPLVEDGKRRYAVGNQVGDAVVLYGLVFGPLWARAKELLV